jgi:hypothetical protein
MITLTLLSLLLASSPAFAQDRVYTNADLGHHQVTWNRSVTGAEAAAILAPHQFVYTPPLPHGPKVVILHSSSTAGPFGEFPPFPATRRLDGTPVDSPYGCDGCSGLPIYGGLPWGFGFPPVVEVHTIHEHIAAPPPPSPPPPPVIVPAAIPKGMRVR